MIGHPVAHSRSPFIHALFARQTGQNLTYQLLEAAPYAFERTVDAFLAEGGRGLNVTLPHKQAAAAYVDRLTDRASEAGAVNTIAVLEDGTRLGDITDGIGLVRDLRHNLGIALRDSHILLLGAGGAARGVLGALLAERPAHIEIANRDAARAEELAAQFAALGSVRGGGLEAVPPCSYDLVINATSASLNGTVPAIPASVISARTVCYDMAYATGETPFTTWARERGAERTAKGWGMLVEQAAESFALWRGVRPDTGPVLAALTCTVERPAG